MKKSFKKTLAVLMAVVTVAGMGSISASANSNDTDFENIPIYPGVSNTFIALSKGDKGVRKKDNSSCVYVNIISSTYSTVRVQTWGLSTESWEAESRVNCTMNASGNLTTCVSLQTGSKYRINNCIKTHNLSYAGLKFQSGSQYNGDTIEGVWSPDYVTESGVLLAGS